MSGSVVGIIVLACTFGGALIGLFLRKALPGHHLDSDSRDTIKVGIGLIATMTALGGGPRCLDSLMGGISSDSFSFFLVKHQAASANG